MRRRGERGITLIALIITIIVMLILVGVTVRVALNGGLFDTAKIASLDTRAEMVREKAEEWKVIKEADNYTDNKKAQTLEELVNDLESQKLLTAEEKEEVLSTGQVTIGSRTIVFEIDEDFDLLERYFLGEDKSGNVRADEVFRNLIFIGNNIIQDADKSIKFYNGMLGGPGYENIPIWMEITYKQKAYKVLINNESLMIDNLERIYSLKGREGQKVLYSYDGTQENLKEWTILHDYGDTIEIISQDVFGPFTIGRKDTTIDWTNSNVISEANIDGTEGLSDAEKTVYSYNHAIENLNKYCEAQITNTNKVSVRSVGSNPSNPSSENATLYIYDKLPEGYPNGVAKSADENYLEDYRAMQCLNISNIGESFFLASRYIDVDKRSAEFYILVTGSYEVGWLELNDGLWYLEFSTQEMKYFRDRISGVRPVVRVNADSVDIIN